MELWVVTMTEMALEAILLWDHLEEVAVLRGEEEVEEVTAEVRAITDTLKAEEEEEEAHLTTLARATTPRFTQPGFPTRLARSPLRSLKATTRMKAS